jgi:hypothetical protein
MNLEGYIRRRTEIEIGSKKWIFSELSIIDFVKFKSFLSEKKKKTNEERRERLISDAQKIGNVDSLELLKLVDDSISDEEFDKEMETVEGLGYLGYLSLKYAHPEITSDNAMTIVTIDKLGEITEAMFPQSKKKLSPTQKQKESLSQQQ